MHSEPHPQTRANYTKLALHQIKSLAAPDRDRVYAELGELRGRVREAGLLEWVDAQVHVAVADAIRRALGASDARTLWRDVMVTAFHRKLLAPLVRGSLKLHGHGPMALVRRIPQAYSLVFRDGGHVEIATQKQRTNADVRFVGMPKLLFDSDALLDSMAGNCDAILWYLEIPGTVERAIEDGWGGAVVYHMSWGDGG